MKKVVLTLVILLLTGVLFVFANGDQEAGGTGTGGQEVIELDFNDWNPEGTGPAVNLWADVVKMIEEKSNGQIQVTNYLSGSLVKFPETFKGVSSGISDISLYLLGGAPGVHELTEIFDLPFLGFKDYDQATQIYNEMLDKFPEIQEENAEKGVRILSLRPMPPYWFHSVKKPIRLPEDVSGEKVISTGYYGMIASLQDGVAMNSGPGDWYSGLQKGVYGHITCHWASFGIYQLPEVAKIHTQFGEGGLGNSGMSVLVNLKTWNTLTPEQQEIIEEAYKWYQVEVRKADIQMVERFKQAAIDDGHEFHELTPEEVKEWQDTVGKQIHDKWVADMDKVGKGDTARAMLGYIQKRINEI